MNLIRQKLMLKGKSQFWLSNKAGISPQHLNRIVQEKVIPLLPTGMKIARALGCAVEELFVYPEEK